MDYLSGIFDTLSPEKKLLNAVMSNNLDEIAKLIKEGGTHLINAPLYAQNQRTALHIACESDYSAVVQLLVNAGSDVNALDFFEFTPLTLALRSGKSKCAKIILQNSSWHPESIWRGREEPSGVPYWTNFSETILCLIVIGTPNILTTLNIHQLNIRCFMGLCEKYAELAKAFCLTGNRLPEDMLLQSNTNNPTNLSNLRKWDHKMNYEVQTLEHYARIAVRRSLNTNIFYGARLLPIPVSLQNFLIFEEEIPF